VSSTQVSLRRGALHRRVDRLLPHRVLFSLFLLKQVGFVQLLDQVATEREFGVELDPGRSQHEVDMTSEFVAPELDHSAQVELADHIVRLDQRVHVGFQAVFSVDTFLVKLNLDKAIRVGSDDEVDFGPVDHDYFLHVVHDVG